MTSSTDASGDVGAAPDLLNRGEFGTIIVDLQLGDLRNRQERAKLVLAVGQSGPYAIRRHQTKSLLNNALPFHRVVTRLQQTVQAARAP